MGLGHGGGDNLDRKPNDISLMNTSYALCGMSPGNEQ